MNRKKTFLLMIPVTAVTLAVIAGIVLYLDPGLFIIRKKHPLPWDGVVRQYDSGVLAVDNIRFTGIPDWKTFAGVMNQLRDVREIRLSGEFALPDIMPMPFSFSVERNIREQRCAMVLRAGDARRGLSVKAEMDSISPVTAQYLTGKLSGRLSELELRYMGTLAGRIHGEASFDGNFIFSLSGGGSNEVDLTGDFERGSWLDAGFFRLNEPGRFQFKKNGSDWSLILPDAVSELSSVSLSGIGIQGNSSGSRVRISGRLSMAQYCRLSRDLTFSGYMDTANGDWHFSAVASEAVFMTAQAMQCQLDSVKLGGDGNMHGGRVSFHGGGPVLTFRSGDEWQGSDVLFEGVRVLKFPAAGKVSAVSEEMTLKFRKLELIHGDRRISADNTVIRFTGKGRKDFMLHGLFSSGSIVSRREGEVLTFEKPGISGDFLFSGGGIAVAENISMKAEIFSGRRGEVSLQMLAPVITGSFDRLKKSGENNFDFLFRGEALKLSGDRYSVESRSGSWRLCAGLPGGVRRPEVWWHSLRLQDGLFEFAPVKGRFTAAGVELEAADSDLALRSVSVNLSGLSGACRNIWQFELKSLNGKGVRRLDGWNGAVHGEGSFSSGDGKWKLGKVNFNLPFAPGSVAPVKGTLTASGVKSPGGMADSLRAEMKFDDRGVFWNGTSSSARFSGGGLFFNGRLNRTGDNPGLFFEYTMPLTTLAGKVSGAEISPALSGWEYSGRIGASGTFSAGVDGIKHAAEYRFDGKAELSPWVLDGLSGTIKTVSGNTAPDFGLEFRFADGTGRLKSVDSSGILTLEVKDILAEQLISVPAGTVMGGRYTGVVRGKWEKSGFVLAEGTLSGGEGALRLDKLEKYRYVPAGADTGLLKFSAAAFRGFAVEKSGLRMRRGDLGLDLRISAEGSPLEELPFVYDNGTFREKREGEFGFSGNVTITSDYRIID